MTVRKQKGAARILVVEDDPKTGEILSLYLKNAGYEPLVARNGRAGLELGRQLRPALVILDLMLPGMDGWTICKELRRDSDVPILILSARQEEDDRLTGLGLGADDYVVKPFSPREVVLRVEAILRRTSVPRAAQAATPGTPGMPADPAAATPTAVLDHDARVFEVEGERVALTPSEYRLLSALCERPGRTLDREELLRRLYPEGRSVVPKVVDVHIGNLRKKVEPDPLAPRYIVTVRGFGYRFDPAPASP